MNIIYRHTFKKKTAITLSARIESHWGPGFYFGDPVFSNQWGPRTLFFYALARTLTSIFLMGPCEMYLQPFDGSLGNVLPTISWVLGKCTSNHLMGPWEMYFQPFDGSLGNVPPTISWVHGKCTSNHLMGPWEMYFQPFDGSMWNVPPTIWWVLGKWTSLLSLGFLWLVIGKYNVILLISPW